MQTPIITAVTVRCDCGESLTATGKKPFACPNCMQVYNVTLQTAFPTRNKTEDGKLPVAYEQFTNV